MFTDSYIRTGRGRDGFLGIACALGIVAIALGAPAQAGETAGALDVRVLESTPDRIVIEYSIDDFSLEPVTIDGQKYAQIGFGKESLMKVVGAPALPNVTRSIIIPDDAEMAVEVVTAEHHDILDVDVVPSKGFIPRTLNPQDVPYTFGPEYDTDMFYPGELTGLRKPYVLRDHRGVVVETNPFQYNPVSRTLRVYTRLVVQVVPVGPGKVNVLDRSGVQKSLSLAFHEIYEHHFLNYAPPLRYTPLDESGEMLIICYDAWLSNMQPLVDHKNARGITTTAVGVSTIGNNATSIKNYIQGVYSSGDLAFVLLVGDAAQVATPSASGGASDPTYSKMTADDYPDIMVGRFSAQNAAQVDTQVERTMEYELMPATGQDWFWKGTGIASNQGPGDDGEYDNVHMDNIRDDLLAHGYTLVDQIYDPTASSSQVTTALNAGRGIVNYCGHGGPTSWSSSGFSNTHVNALANNNMLPFICSVACNNGEFDNYTTCFGEAWLQATNGTEPTGAIGMYASSISQSWDPPMDAQDEFVDMYVSETYSTLGTLLYAGSCHMMDEYASGGVSMFNTWILFGDPSLRVVVTCVDAGIIDLDKAKYLCEDTAGIRVNDCGMNTDDAVVDTVTVTIKSTAEPAGESVLLTETDPASADFAGSITLSATDAAGVLLIGEGDTITATYVDAEDGEGGYDVVVTDTASVDCTPPNISNVQATNIEPRSAMVVFNTDEPANGTVHYGLACETLNQTAYGSGYSTFPTVGLSGLFDDKTYFYTVEAADEAGNTAGDDNGEECYTFTTPEVPDYFTELFESDNDLDDLSLTFIPDGSNDFYFGCVEPIEELPTDPSGGTSLSFSPSDDDGSATVNLSEGAMVSIYGQSHGTFYPGTNGYITFVHGESGYTESLEDHLGGIPRISALYDDLNANYGTVSWKQLDDRAVVTWENIPEYSNTGSNTFQIEMFFDGTIVISYLSISASDGLAGLSEGQGLDPDFFETDLSAMGNCGPRPPTAENMEVNTPVEIPVTIAFEAADDGLPDPPAALTYIVMSLPEHGPLTDLGAGLIVSVPYTLVGGGNEVEYAPDSWFAGMDGFQFKVNDGGIAPDGGDSNVATISLAVGGLTPTYVFPLDSDPGWNCEEQWAFGKPSGNGSYGGDPLAGYTGYYVYGYNLNGDYGNSLSAAYLTTGAFNCSSLTGTELRFRRWLGVDSSSSDHASVEVSNNGVIWTAAWDHSGGAISESSWSLQIYDLSAAADGQSQVYVRWGMGPTNSSTTYPGWNLDDIEIWGIQPLTDCNDNDVPDNVDIAEGTSLDCNSNLYPDECDLVEGTSPDCNSNEIPDECDAAEGTSSDVNGNGVPDECEPPPAMACAPPDGISKNRYVSFEPANGAFTVAYQVELTDSAYFPDSKGVLGWVGEVDGENMTKVVGTPFFSDSWPAVVHLGDCQIVPVAMYELRSTVDGTMFSDPLAVATIAQPTPKMWGDVVGEFDGSAWTEPNGEINMDDVMAAVQRFRQVAGAPPLIWVDVDAEVPNGVLNFTDVMRIVQGFKGEDYPFSAPADCP